VEGRRMFGGDNRERRWVEWYHGQVVQRDLSPRHKIKTKISLHHLAMMPITSYRMNQIQSQPSHQMNKYEQLGGRKSIGGWIRGDLGSSKGLCCSLSLVLP
jgi:hypothetical protein